MSLNNNRKGTFVNLVDGKFVIKNLKTGEKEIYDNLTGRIVGFTLKDDNIKGKVDKRILLQIVDNIDTYLLEIRLDSGYFRTFCNSLKSGNPKKIITLSALCKPLPNGKKNTVMFVIQDGKTLKHFHKKDNMGDCPETEIYTIKGETIYDNSEKIAFYIEWLKSVNFSDSGNGIITDAEKKEIIEEDGDEIGDIEF